MEETRVWSPGWEHSLEYKTATHSSILVGKISTGRGFWWARQPTAVLLPGKSHGQRSLVGCSPWGHKESDMTERRHFHSKWGHKESDMTEQLRMPIPFLWLRVSTDFVCYPYKNCLLSNWLFFPLFTFIIDTFNLVSSSDILYRCASKMVLCLFFGQEIRYIIGPNIVRGITFS